EEKLFNLLLLFVCITHIPTYAQTGADEEGSIVDNSGVVEEGRDERSILLMRLMLQHSIGIKQYPRFMIF
ncbi:hypothetical protein, partial [Ignatzschineria indica]|uniref:hypothetical protein n=1 Tax=Ignatzschineria indica TaxID=472583 RepID=UPI003642D157